MDWVVLLLLLLTSVKKTYSNKDQTVCIFSLESEVCNPALKLFDHFSFCLTFEWSFIGISSKGWIILQHKAKEYLSVLRQQKHWWTAPKSIHVWRQLTLYKQKAGSSPTWRGPHSTALQHYKHTIVQSNEGSLWDLRETASICITPERRAENSNAAVFVVKNN